MSLDSGELTYPLVHRVLTKGRGAAGGASKSWADGETLWCEREQTSGFIRTASQSERASTRVEWRTYWNANVRAGERLRDEDNVEYEIEEKRPINDREYMVLVTTTTEGRA